MTQTEALRLALEALENMANIRHCQREKGYPLSDADKRMQEAIPAIKAALEAKNEPEYYGLTKDHLWMSISKEHYDRLKPEFRMACYTIPPQRKPLSYEELESLVKWYGEKDNLYFNRHEFARAIEAAHGIKGEAK